MSTSLITDHERRIQASRIILIMAMFTILFCFIPIIASKSQTASDDDHSCQNLQTATSCLVIAIIPMGDLLLEWINCSSFFSGIFSVFGIEQRKKRVQASAFLDTSSVRMNLCERTLFVVAVVCLGGEQSFPTTVSSPLRSTLGFGFSEVSGVLARSSIISLICRISPTWTPLRSISLVIILNLFHIVFVCTQLYPSLKSLHLVLIGFSLGCIFFSLCLILWTIYDMWKQQTIHQTNEQENGKKNPDVRSSAMANEVSEQRLHNIVIMTHLFAAFCPGVIQVAWDYFGSQWTAGIISSPHSLSLSTNHISSNTTRNIPLLLHITYVIFFMTSCPDKHSSIIYFQLACGVVVFLLDGRVRKIESVTAVFEFLDFKKSYLNHISHELHIPLHAATLGLNMAITHIHKHNQDHVVDNELIETLSGIRLACNAAVNSLNDFLFSERTETGILDLCLETIPVVDYVCGAINHDLLSDHAIAKKLTLDVLFHVDATVLTMHPTAVPLRSNDCISCDRSKMHQVLQKLVNNAIKFSQENSTVTIRAYFCPSVDDKSPVSSTVADKIALMESKDILLRDITCNTLTKNALGEEKNREIATPHSTSPSPLCPNDIVGYLMVTVTDTGPGISEERKKHIFRGVTDHPHYHDNYTNDTNHDSQRSMEGLSEKSGGSGFGLFISRCMVDLHRGSMGVDSAGEGLGATFTLSIPMTRKRENIPDNHSTGATLGGLASPFQPTLTRQQQQQQQQTTDQFHDSNNDEYLLVDMKDVFQSQWENHRGDDHVRFATTVHTFNINTESSHGPEKGKDIRVNGTKRAHQQYPQHHRHPTRNSFTLIKHTLPFADGLGDDSGGSGDDVNSISSTVDGDNHVVQQSCHTTLPLTSHHIQMTHDDRPPPPPCKDDAFSSSGKNQYRLLIMDDSHLLVKALRVDGHHCDEVNDALTAMIMLNSKITHDQDHGNVMYDAVIIATRDGPSICKSIRTLSPNVTIFGVTNTVFFREDSRRYKAYGATSVLVKPFDMAFFMDFLSQMENLEFDNQSNEMMV